MELILFEACNPRYSDSVRRLLPADYEVLRTETLDDASIPTLFSYLLNTARKHDLFDSWQTTVLSHKEFFESLKVVCSRINYESYGEFNVPTSEVIITHVEYSGGNQNPRTDAYRKFSKECNTIDQFGLLRLLENNFDKIENDFARCFRIEGPVRNDWQKSAIELLARNKRIRRVQLELPVDIEISTIGSNQLSFEELKGVVTPKDISCPKFSQSLEYTITILKSFINLLVNSRDEVAIACALACPLVNLSHEAFTVIKRAASDDQSPIYQYIQSYVLQKRLGGAGYAAPKDCPVRNFLKEMNSFMEIMDKLQTFIEEHTMETAVSKISNCVLNRLSKEIVGQPLKSAMIEKSRDITRMLTERVKHKNVDAKIPAGFVGRETIHLLRSVSDELASLGYFQKPAKLLCSPFSAATPSKTPVGAQTMFKLFKSPAAMAQDDDEDLIPLAIRAPQPVTPKARTAAPFSVKYEPEPPKLKIFEDTVEEVFQSTQSALDEEERASLVRCRTANLKMKANSNCDTTPVLKKTAPKRKDAAGGSKQGAKKRLKLVSANDPENISGPMPAKTKATTSSKLKTSKSKAKQAVPPNQKSIDKFFLRI